jgi:integrase
VAAKEGKDPSAERAQARQVLKFGELVDWYLENHSRPHKRSWRRDERRFHVHFNAWMTRRLSDIKLDDVTRAHVRIGATKPVEANRAVQLLRGMFYAAIKGGIWRGDNPAKGIRAFKEQRRERFLTPDELQRVNEALIEETDGNWKSRAYFPLLLLTGLRRSELASLRWDCVDMNSRTLRLPETKTGKTHTEPISSPAVQILEGLPSRGMSEWLFPAESASGHMADPFPMWDRIRKRAGVPDVRIHDLRHTLASWMVAQGFSLPMIGRALNHARAATTERYAHLQLEPVRQALEATALLMFPAPARDSDTEAGPIEEN